MTIGAPIDGSIRQVIIRNASSPKGLADSSSNLDPTPQLVMTPGSEQFAFQYPDGLGDGRDKYESLDGSQNQTTSISLDDFISIFVDKPTNKTYIIGFNIPIPVQIINSSFSFGTGPGSATFQTGTINAGSNITMTVTGTTSASANLAARLYVRTNHQG